MISKWRLPNQRHLAEIAALVLVVTVVRWLLTQVVADRSPLSLYILVVAFAGARQGVVGSLVAMLLSLVAGMAFILPYYPNIWLSIEAWGNIGIFLLTSAAVTLIIRRTRAVENEVRSSAVQVDHANRALATSEDRYRSIIETAADAVIVIDGRGRIREFNAAAEAMFCYQLSDVRGHNVSMLMPKSDAKVHDGHIDRYTSKGGPSIIGKGRELLALRRDGSSFPIELAVGEWHGADGKRLFTGIIRDISERVRAAAALRTANENLEARVADRTGELDELVRELNSFSYTVSHDLRAPIRSMSGFAGALLEDYPEGTVLDRQGRQFAERIAAAAGRMDRLINDLLRYSRLAATAVVLEPVDLGKAVAAAIADHMAAIEAAAAKIEVAAPLPLVLASPTLLHQVLSNIIGNALKFVAPSNAPRIEIAAQQASGQVKLSLTDNGIGIEPAHQDRIFQVFERLHGDGAYAGTGIGLAIARKAAERMRGTLVVTSHVDAGSTFTLTLKAARRSKS